MKAAQLPGPHHRGQELQGEPWGRPHLKLERARQQEKGKQRAHAQAAERPVPREWEVGKGHRGPAEGHFRRHAAHTEVAVETESGGESSPEAGSRANHC